MNIDDLEMLLPGPTVPSDDSWTWAAVTGVSPLRIKIDGESAALPITPDTLVSHLRVNDRVWVQRRGRRLIIHGKAESQDVGALASYPVGSIFLSVSSTNPGSVFGGTWVSWGVGRVPIGVDTSDTDFNTVEKTGGAKTHSHSIPGLSIPQHRHNFRIAVGMFYGAHVGDTWQAGSGAYRYSSGSFGGDEGTAVGSTSAAINSNITTAMQNPSAYSIRASTGDTDVNPSGTTTGTGTSGAADHKPPYITCYMWKRTA